MVESLLKAESSGGLVPLSMSKAGGEITISVGPGNKAEATVWVAMVQPKAVVPISRGENTGHEIAYHNVVRKLIPAGMWHGEKLTLTLPKADLFTDGASACAAFLQVEGVGAIIGAAGMGPLHG